ncbi:IclR family transcriptional regulator C-terminal domain-containing protein [Nocardioides sp. GY 10127]|uniref:IclR family transcriptional regulator n=1 Tax=Nocardioides sp. GY 10127 TaxID=2569762 RepID=UPI0014588CAE|nr:IclR family transcriptional regulator C-terminal domain-containing protein [Nocardioides sp. GY 10127]
MSTAIASSLDKALSLLFAFADPEEDQRVLTVSGLAERSGMDKAQVSRSLATFAKYGLVERLGPRRGYQLGWAVVHMASRALLAQTISSTYPRLAQLAAEIEETVYISVRDGSQQRALAVFEPDRMLYVQIRTGRPEPLIGTASGYGLLVRSDEQEVRAVYDSIARRDRAQVGSWSTVWRQLREIAEQGYAVVTDPGGEHVTSAAVPIFDVGNYADRVYATVAVSAPEGRFEAQRELIIKGLQGIAGHANDFLQGQQDPRG